MSLTKTATWAPIAAASATDKTPKHNAQFVNDVASDVCHRRERPGFI